MAFLRLPVTAAQVRLPAVTNTTPMRRMLVKRRVYLSVGHLRRRGPLRESPCPHPCRQRPHKEAEGQQNRRAGKGLTGGYVPAGTAQGDKDLEPAQGWSGEGLPGLCHPGFTASKPPGTGVTEGQSLRLLKLVPKILRKT